MVKFLSGGQFDGSRVPVCTFWRSDVRTNTDEDFSALAGTGRDANEAVQSPDSPFNQCIANAFFKREDITCFNEGNCNGEGKCLPCSKYKYGGMRFGITHSPPLEFLRQFEKGLTEADIRSPNLVAFPPNVINQRQRDQLPLHVLYKNIMAQISKCCHWNAGDGAPSKFYLARVRGGPDIATVLDESGNSTTLRGILIQNPVFPDEVGTFVPAGSVVIAGFEGQPSFYLEPRTGLPRPGDGVIFGEEGNANAPLLRIKQASASSTQTIIDTVNATIAVCTDLTAEFERQANFLNNAFNTSSPPIIRAAEDKFNDLAAREEIACVAASDAQDLGQDANDLIGDIVATTSFEDALALSKQLTVILNQIADLAEAASIAGTGRTASANASRQAGLLRRIARDLAFAAFGSFSKCEFFFEENNVALQWNNPDDGTLPCNGVRTDCQFYTGEEWQFATDEKLDIGSRITAEALQEIRFRSDDWSRYVDPEEQFRNRFATPFIWAFDRYVEVFGSPEIEDLILYKPQTLFLKNPGAQLPADNYETIQMEKVSISDFDSFAISKSAGRVQPGHSSLDLDLPPQFPTKVAAPNVPSINRLRIAHPDPAQLPFIYRTWSPDKNKITLFGAATPNSTVYLVNLTALRERPRYHTFLGTQNFVPDLPEGLPGAPSFVGISPAILQDLFSLLEDEKRLNDSPAPLGFHAAEVDRRGFWQSIQELDLVHNQVNEIVAIVLVNDFQILVDSTKVDYRFLHSIPIQDSFAGKDFSLNSSALGAQSQFGISSGNITKGGQVTATPQQVVGTEEVKFAYGYMGWRFKDRSLRFGTLNADNDLLGDVQIGDTDPTSLVTEAGPSEFISGTAYHVVQYQKEDVEINNWYLINDCGFIMIEIPDLTANRVLPLPNQQGAIDPLSDVLLNGGGRGAVIAQFALLDARLEIGGEAKTLVQEYRDPDGFGLPANFIVLGPSTDVEQAFGRPVLGRDTVTISYTYLQAQTATKEATPELPTNEDLVLEDNFFGDNLRGHNSIISFLSDGSFSAGDNSGVSPGTLDAIRTDQQDYVWVFADATGRPIGRKVTRMMLMYYNMACINVELFYRWVSTCTTYGLAPDLFLQIGRNDGTVVKPPKGTIDPRELSLGHRVANLLGEFDCGSTPSCGDHEFLNLGPLRREFEVIVQSSPESTSQEAATPSLKAAFPSAGGVVAGKILTSERPGSQYLRRKGPLWFPYIVCERPRYDAKTNGPMFTDSTELINEEISPAGVSIGSQVLNDNQVSGAQGTFGNLPREDFEAYRGPDRVVAKILDTHPSLRQCTNEYTYGNQVLTGRNASFVGAARRRGEIDPFWYTGLNWTPPPFGNFGRGKLVFEITEKRGDFLGGEDNRTVGFRWMPLFPEREDLGSGIDLFSEEMEPQHYRFIQSSGPLGSINEVVTPTTRFTHKELIQNKTVAGIEYPSVTYYPSFIPDAFLGTAPETRETQGLGYVTGTITTMWAWREKEKPIRRGQSDSNVLAGIRLASPDYFLDQRRLEVRLRPVEGIHALTFIPPTYDVETGELITNAALRLNDGPPRQITIDFANRVLNVALQEDTVYDTSLNIGDDPFPCAESTPTDNPLLTSKCSCITDSQSPALEGPPAILPAQFLHLDSIAPDGFVTLYESESLNSPFAIPLSRETSADPCCMCVYYIRGLFFKLDLEFLPTAERIDPAFDSRLAFSYTWSRPPHGLLQGEGTDGVFSANENLIDNYVDHTSGQVFINRFISDLKSLSTSLDAAAIFPATEIALAARADETPISVADVAPEDLHNIGGPVAPATGGESFGEDETISLDFRFETYVKVKSVTVTFFAGNGWQVPAFSLGVVDPQFRGVGAEDPSVRTVRLLANSTLLANGTNVPFLNLLDTDAVREGLPGGVGARFPVTLTPSYADASFWNQFGMEFHLTFARRDGTNSMGIAGIELEVEAMVPGSELSEEIFVPERKYYTSIGSPGGGNNPEEFLQEADSATVYWRQAETGGTRGSNKFRAYSFGVKLEDNQAPLRGEPQELEQIQGQEYDAAKDLMPAPYEFTFATFVPPEESSAIQFYGGEVPVATLNMSMAISPVDEVRQEGSGNRLYGRVPTDRNPWHAPGHTWTFQFVDNYDFCCSPCPRAMVIDYNFAHLHDGLAVVETARFWDELPSGFTRLIRSTLLSPDPTFGQQKDSGMGITGGTSGQATLIEEREFTDSQGNAIDVTVLENAGFRKDAEGNLILLPQGGE